MRLRMLETRRGTEDGFTIRLYEAGCEYDIADTLARSFIADGVGVQVLVTQRTLRRKKLGRRIGANKSRKSKKS